MSPAEGTAAIVVATRRSRLALIQAETVRTRLGGVHPSRLWELRPIGSRGDRLAGVSLEAVEGTGFFTSDLEDAVLDGRAHLAVHSLKDLPTEIGAGLVLAAILTRDDPRDVLVSPHGGLDDLPRGSRVGTDSNRRRAQILALRPDLEVEPVRGNVPTRLAKLDRGDFDALVLAAAGLRRLGLDDRLANPLDPADCLPAPGQGAIAVEAVAGSEAAVLAAAIDDPQTRAAVTAERTFLAAVGGGCRSAAGALATCSGDRLDLEAGIFEAGRPVRVRVTGALEDAEQLGRQAALGVLGSVA